jgi:hypothetical protein
MGVQKAKHFTAKPYRQPTHHTKPPESTKYSLSVNEMAQMAFALR